MTSLQQLSIIKEDMKSEAYLEVKYSNLEDWDSVLRTKLMARVSPPWRRRKTMTSKCSHTYYSVFPYLFVLLRNSTKLSPH